MLHGKEHLINCAGGILVLPHYLLSTDTRINRKIVLCLRLFGCCGTRQENSGHRTVVVL